jgi:hypothetical protein
VEDSRKFSKQDPPHGRLRDEMREIRGLALASVTLVEETPKQLSNFLGSPA